MKIGPISRVEYAAQNTRVEELQREKAAALRQVEQAASAAANRSYKAQEVSTYTLQGDIARAKLIAGSLDTWA